MRRQRLKIEERLTALSELTPEGEESVKAYFATLEGYDEWMVYLGGPAKTRRPGRSTRAAKTDLTPSGDGVR